MPILDRFDWIDAIDVAVLALLAYQAFVLISGTRAWNLLRGILAVGLVYGLARLLGLSATTWLFDRLAPVGILALVIVFQPELRSALERVGRRRLRRSGLERPIDEIMQAVRTLSRTRTGALIALERNVPITDVGDQAVVLNAPVKASLIETVFQSEGPLHDGAMVVRNDRLAMAGAIFPLSDVQGGWNARLGTRHRAALGMAEQSDAYVIVVSEERGDVSVAQNGHLRTDMTPSDLLPDLKAFFQRRDGDRS